MVAFERLEGDAYQIDDDEDVTLSVIRRNAFLLHGSQKTVLM